jgi:tetratricopeptide (TPR) repeat protein
MTRALQEKAQAYMSNNEWDAAIICLEEAIKTTPENVYVLDKLAFCYSRAKRYTEAITLYEKLCQMQPDVAKWPYGLGYQYYDQQQYQQAIAHFDQALEINPAYLVVLYRKGYALSQLGFSERGHAVHTLKKCREAYHALPDGNEKDRELKNYSDATYQQGKLLLDANYLDEARELLEEATKLRSKDSDTYYALGKCYLDLGRYDEALEALLTAQRLAEKPSHYVSDRLAQAYMARGDLEQALTIYESIPPFVRDNWAYIQRNMGDLYCQLERWNDAEAVLQKSLKKDRRNHNAHHQLGRVYEQQAKWSLAARAYREAINLRQKQYSKPFPEAESALANLLATHPEIGQQPVTANEVPKSASGRSVGRIKRFFDERGFGFIEVPGRKSDLFFHISAVKEQERVQVGEYVEYTETVGKGGKPAAVDVVLLKRNTTQHA